MSITDEPIFEPSQTFSRGYAQGRLDALQDAKRAVEVSAFATHANDRPETQRLFHYTLLQIQKLIDIVDSQ